MLAINITQLNIYHIIIHHLNILKMNISIPKYWRWYWKSTWRLFYKLILYYYLKKIAHGRWPLPHHPRGLRGGKRPDRADSRRLSTVYRHPPAAIRPAHKEVVIPWDQEVMGEADDGLFTEIQCITASRLQVVTSCFICFFSICILYKYSISKLISLFNQVQISFRLFFRRQCETSKYVSVLPGHRRGQLFRWPCPLTWSAETTHHKFIVLLPKTYQNTDSFCSFFYRKIKH